MANRVDMIFAPVYMEKAALILSLLSLLGFAANNRQTSSGLTLKNPTEK